MVEASIELINLLPIGGGNKGGGGGGKGGGGGGGSDGGKGGGTGDVGGAAAAANIGAAIGEKKIPLLPFFLIDYFLLISIYHVVFTKNEQIMTKLLDTIEIFTRTVTNSNKANI